ncbi:MAG: dihydrolipoyl dehydrogenase [Chlamydiae bacterium RIFCSPHIGHO2_12_FULL_44_59]|nr:MAG: dihydrolipoyl dehydrogenase [Chlamydiae bacterium RIFCSPHIGHO2_01_FULL_44_39]OGN60459.1 MAG: dihydrolipoyl dehydrogenase [Chlamydiae bacterium RIFCSPHIGHO2_12_FULL_44_59]OGN66580.1 MAG: dihydrolipoyl dehydrogenase [Chlamydiae bacterium RIFCSPLOWO2_01_FULL_44_52]OGN69829.1 MAG: dihydrolipoyl dehydrogenase [Chlamydiae bacterium RIFCSPLOWO2_02_FULL_45_22]OGN70369.1 MAG: dihydrolipoyl dehydrogenase [Chlamydiae bacterium RIFCSPLOWO2_12_FULL_45_20]
MTTRKTHDIAIIGSGPGGYVAAIRAAQLGKSVGLIEKDFIGGCCLNVGCIPTKTLLSNAAVLHQVKRAKEFGISVGSIQFHYDQMKKRKDSVIEKLRSSLESLIQSNQITIYRGTASFESPKTLKVMGHDNIFINAGKMIIATGSVPLDIKAFPCDNKRIFNSTSLLELTEAPKSLAIIGGGYIGCEFASLFVELNTKVTILEALPTILATQGEQVSQFLSKSFMHRGIEIQTSALVRSIETQTDHVHITFSDGKTMDAEFALVAVGRQVYTDGLHLEKAGVLTHERGFIETNERMETGVPGIYAIGDVTGKWMLAHVASHQGVVAASNACGIEAKMHYEAVPAVVFTTPEIATVGYTVEEAKKAGFQAAKGWFPFPALGKAQAALETEGFAQIVFDEKTNQILGASVVGHEASNLIGEMALAIQNELTLESVIETIHAHPTMGESWHEAALMAYKTPIHLPPVKKR